MTNDSKIYYLFNSTTWRKYPVEITQSLSEEILGKCKKKHKWQKIRFVISLMLCEVVVRVRSEIFDVIYGLGRIGYFKSTVTSKVCRICDPPVLKQHCRRIRFVISGIIKNRAIRKLNKDNSSVIKYMNIKKWNRKQVIERNNRAREWYEKQMQE